MLLVVCSWDLKFSIMDSVVRIILSRVFRNKSQSTYIFALTVLYHETMSDSV